MYSGNHSVQIRMSLPSRRRVNTADITTLSSLLSHTTARLIRPTDADYASSIARWSMAAVKPAGPGNPANKQQPKYLLYYDTLQQTILISQSKEADTLLREQVQQMGDSALIYPECVVCVSTIGKDTKCFRIEGGATWADVDEVGEKEWSSQQ